MAKTVPQLKALAKEHGYKVSGEVVESFFDSYTKTATKLQYVNLLSTKLKLADLNMASAKK